MIGTAEFNSLFALKLRTLTPDGMGTETNVDSTVEGYDAVPAYVQTLPTKEVVVGEKIVHETLKNVFCNIAPSVVTTDHFLTIDSIDYEIIDIVPTSPLRLQIQKKV